MLLGLHVAAGFTSIALFFVPAIAKKGGELHNRSGRWYTYTMWTVVVTAVVLCGWQYGRGYTSSSLFLGFISLLTARPLYYGIAVLRNKKGPSERMQKIDFGLRLALGLFSIFMVGTGLGWWGTNGHNLNVIFGVLGVIVWPSLIRDLRGRNVTYNWLEEHLAQMSITAIAAFTAFLAFGGRRLFGDLFSGNLEIVLWTAPTVLGVAFIRYYKWRLRKRKAAGLPLFTVLLLLCLGGNLHAQLYVEKQTRHRFAQLNFGLDYQVSNGGKAVFMEGNTARTQVLSRVGTPRILLGGTHFWGHADFQIAFPVTSPKSVFEDRSVSALAGVETAFKYYPWRIEHKRLRPYVGVGLVSFYYEQEEGSDRFREGPGKDVVRLPLKAGLNFNHGPHLLEAGLTWNYADRMSYAISQTRFADVELPSTYFSLSYRYLIDTTVGAEEDWESGRTKKVTEVLAKKGKLSGPFLAVGPSSAWWNGKSSFNETARPWIEGYSTSIMMDYALGYYFHRADLNVNLSYRNMQAGETAYGSTQSLQRRSLGLEVTKMLGDYHGFVPFVGPIFSRESLRFTDDTSRQVIRDPRREKWAAGITFGWDIRPNRAQYFLLRTNLRWYPKLELSVVEGQAVSLNALEFNFIQLVVFPGRMF